MNIVHEGGSQSTRHASIAWRRDCLWWRKHGAAQGIDGMFVFAR